MAEYAKFKAKVIFVAKGLKVFHLFEKIDLELIFLSQVVQSSFYQNKFFLKRFD